ARPVSRARPAGDLPPSGLAAPRRPRPAREAAAELAAPAGRCRALPLPARVGALRAMRRAGAAPDGAGAGQELVGCVLLVGTRPLSAQPGRAEPGSYGG